MKVSDYIVRPTRKTGYTLFAVQNGLCNNSGRTLLPLVESDAEYHAVYYQG